LYDDAEQVEVRHVLSLALYDIDIYAGGEYVPDGELWVKRNCIRLTWRERSAEVPQDSKPFYLFSDNCSDKEDFYHALLQNQDRIPGYASPAPTPLAFETAHIVKLVQQLHASEENMQTRWINALMGRLFLALYKTTDLQDLIHAKITKKITRVAKPAFIESIKIKRIELGDSAPLLTNPKLRELTIDGDLTIEGDVKYRGNLRLEIAAVARIDLGPRFKVRKVDVLLAGICKSLEGHILIRVKPPPSNRIWFSFETMPKLDLSIEPIVSSRQITYSLILRAIESRIREVIGETLVQPNWDDIPFSDTSAYHVRGGLFTEQSGLSSIDQATPESVSDSLLGHESDPDTDADILPLSEKSMSTPTLVDRRDSSSRKDVIRNGPTNGAAVGVSSALDLASSSQKPRTMRSSSFATVASPTVSIDPATVQSINDHAKGRNEAARVMKDISSRSQPSSPFESPVGSPAAHDIPGPPEQATSQIPSRTSTDIDMGDESTAQSSVGFDSPSRASTEMSLESTESHSGRRSLSQSTASSRSLKRQSIAANAVSATVAARKWGLDLVARHASVSSIPESSKPSMPDTPSYDAPLASPVAESTPGVRAVSDKGQPVGRGMPLPPPGTPLPGPSKASWTAALSGLAKRKPVPNSAGQRPSISLAKPPSTSPSPPPLPQRPKQESPPDSFSSPRSTSSPRPIPAPPLPKRKVRTTSLEDNSLDLNSPHVDDVLVIKAPDSPVEGTSRSYEDPGVFAGEFAVDVSEKATVSGALDTPAHSSQTEEPGLETRSQ
jgi:hypothetical protein